MAFDGSIGLSSRTIWTLAITRVAGAADDVVSQIEVQLIYLRFMLHHRLIAAATLAANLFAGHIFSLER